MTIEADKRRAYNRRYHIENRERIAEQKKRYQGEHSEERAAYQREYYAANRDRLSAYQREYRAANKERARATNARHRAKAKARLDELRANPCVDCGVQYDVAAMEFDHVRGVKKYEITLTSSRRKDFAEELAKCELRCANCHRIRHAKARLLDSVEGGDAVGVGGQP